MWTSADLEWTTEKFLQMSPRFCEQFHSDLTAYPPGANEGRRSFHMVVIRFANLSHAFRAEDRFRQ